jgi:hypothetical protein
MCVCVCVCVCVSSFPPPPPPPQVIYVRVQLEEIKGKMPPKLRDFLSKLSDKEQYQAANPDIKGYLTQSHAEASNNSNKKARGQEMYGEEVIK